MLEHGLRIRPTLNTSENLLTRLGSLINDLLRLVLGVSFERPMAILVAVFLSNSDARRTPTRSLHADFAAASGHAGFILTR